MPGIVSLQDFYRDMGCVNENELDTILPGEYNKEIGHFNVFSTASVRKKVDLPVPCAACSVSTASTWQPGTLIRRTAEIIHAFPTAWFSGVSAAPT